MNGAHWHLVVNHLPIVFPIVGIIVLLSGLLLKSAIVKRTAFMIFMMGAVAAFAAMSTGEGAEDVVKALDSTSKRYIHEHEEIAETFAILSYLLGALSLLGIWASLKQKAFDSILSIGIVILAFVVLFFSRQTGTTGGEIRHPEIRGVVDTAISDNSFISGAGGAGIQ